MIRYLIEPTIQATLAVAALAAWSLFVRRLEKNP